MPPEHEVGWKDGLWKAIHLLGKDCFIHGYNISQGGVWTKSGWDIVLFWGSSQSKYIPEVLSFKCKKAMLFGGGYIDDPILHQFDIVFVEEDWTLAQMRAKGINAHLAFGTNTEIFKPMDLPMTWDYIYPAAFAKWKYHYKFVDYVKGKRALAIGHIQPDNVEEETWKLCLENNITVIPMVNNEVLVWLLNQSGEVVITSDIYGGGQRSVLEALACKRPINKELLNERLLSVYNRGLLTEVDYYKALKKGLWTIL
jgi:hypothetical protein